MQYTRRVRLAVLNLKGGVGKTTSAVNIATLIAARGESVLLVDADPQGSALQWSETVDLGFPVVSLPVRDLHRRVPQLLKDGQHLVIDTPPGNLGVVRSAALATDTILVPVTSATTDIRQLRATFELLADVDQHDPRLAVVLTRVRPRTISSRSARVVLEEFAVPLLSSEIPLREHYVTMHGGPATGADDYGPILAELEETP